MRRTHPARLLQPLAQRSPRPVGPNRRISRRNPLPLCKLRQRLLPHFALLQAPSAARLHSVDHAAKTTAYIVFKPLVLSPAPLQFPAPLPQSGVVPGVAPVFID